MVNITHIPALTKAVVAVKTVVIHSGDEISPLEMKLLEGYNQLRTDYVLQENWPIHASGIDIDTYDVAANSLYVIAHVGERVTAGMRATKVSSIFGSMSYGMWTNAVERDLFELQLEKSYPLLSSFKPGEMWDITRLIAETSVMGNHDTLAKAYSKVGLLKVMSASVVGASHSDVSVWVFTTTKRMLRFMEKSNIKVHVLAEAKISETDAAESIFCIVYPREVFKELKRLDPVTHKIASHTINHHGGLN